MDVKTSCVICTLPRTGSWLLAEALQATGVAGRPEEYLREDWMWQYAWKGRLEFEHLLDYWPSARSQGLSRPPPNEFDVDGFVAAIRAIAATDNGVLGIKLHWQQFEHLVTDGQRTALRQSVPDEAMLRSWFPNPRYVLLTRRDRLRQAISHYRAIETDRWWSTKGARPTDAPSAVTPPGKEVPPGRRGGSELDLAQVEQLRMALIGWEQRWRDLFRRSGVEPLELRYEDLVADPARSLSAVLAHVGAGPSPVVQPGSLLRRQADEITERTIERYRDWRSQAFPIRWPRPGQPSASAARDTMRTETIIVENFYAEPAAVREYALAQEYYYPYEDAEDVRAGRRPFTWMASRFKEAGDCPFKSSADLIAQFERITGEAVDLDHWNGQFPTSLDGRPHPSFQSKVDRTCLWNCCFHCKPDNGQELGDGVHNHVTDTWNGVDIHGWAGIVYLSPDAPTSGGLKLWRNRQLERQFDWMSPRSNWELIDDLGNVPNRLIMCRGNLPHSGARGWGDSLRTGRLYQTFFFRTRRGCAPKSVRISL